ncbi:MAG: hypothetical protein ACLU9S_00010 [Oscillospiraceae bacterium]
MSNVRYNAGTMTIEVDGLDDVSGAGRICAEDPAVAKVAINATARRCPQADDRGKKALVRGEQRAAPERLMQRKKPATAA